MKFKWSFVTKIYQDNITNFYHNIEAYNIYHIIWLSWLFWRLLQITTLSLTCHRKFIKYNSNVFNVKKEKWSELFYCNHCYLYPYKLTTYHARLSHGKNIYISSNLLYILSCCLSNFCWLRHGFLTGLGPILNWGSDLYWPYLIYIANKW